MAAITIRNLPDDVVEALKQRAKRNSRSMEAEVREALTRLTMGEEIPSGLEAAATTQSRALRRTVSGQEINAWIRANPPTPQERRVMDDWRKDLDDWRSIPPDQHEFEDPWEKAARLRKEWLARQDASATSGDTE
ncbi:MAG: hypothetical protein JSS74_14950 [Actinobacteria bacterium]|nr:hypothetical protein [Actinomycetota bacterium]